MVFSRYIHASYTKIRIPAPIIDIYYFQWNNSIRTQIHDHPMGGCFMFLIKGKLIETLYNGNMKQIKKSEYRAPNISYINNKKGYHSIYPNENAKSFHFYYPKGHITQYFD